MTKKVLNLGCGLDHRQDAINVDINPSKRPDIKADLTANEWTWQEYGTVDQIIANHILEHIPNPVNFMDECWKMLKPHGILHIRVPHYEHVTAFSDPTHCNFFTEKTFKLFTQSDETNSFTQRTWTIINQDIIHEPKNGFPWWHLRQWFGVTFQGRPRVIDCRLLPNKGRFQ